MWCFIDTTDFNLYSHFPAQLAQILIHALPHQAAVVFFLVDGSITHLITHTRNLKIILDSSLSLCPSV